MRPVYGSLIVYSRNRNTLRNALTWSPCLRRSPGGLFVFEGFDGSGKSTQLHAAADHLKRRGLPVVETHEPTSWYRSNPIVRQFFARGASHDELIEMALLSALDRRVHIRECILPALRDGYIVLCDRYIFSTLVLFKCRGLSEHWVSSINISVPQPDVSFYFKISASDVAHRLAARDGDKLKFEERSRASIERILEGFECFSDQFEVLDAMLPIAAISQQVIRRISESLGSALE